MPMTHQGYAGYVRYTPAFFLLLGGCLQQLAAVSHSKAGIIQQIISTSLETVVVTPQAVGSCTL